MGSLSYEDEEVTLWLKFPFVSFRIARALKKREDISTGYSCLYLKDGYKISKFLKADGSLLSWYCDIVTYDYNKKDNKLTTIDLLADVIIYPDGKMTVVDLDELYEAFEKKLIDLSLLKKSLLSLNRLLKEINENGIENLAKPIEAHISSQNPLSSARSSFPNNKSFGSFSCCSLRSNEGS